MKKDIFLLLSITLMFCVTSTKQAYSQQKDALSGERFRVIVLSDIGGSDPDDFQSMIHYCLYSDLFDTEGIIASAGDGLKENLLAVIAEYEKDYPKLKTYADYPSPNELRSLTKQGDFGGAPGKGYREPTEASEWIIKCAHKDDERPLYLLAWGYLEDIAQALHDDPSILDKIRVYYIGGPNKKHGADAYNYIEENFPDLWIIESNSTYRGWFVGGDMNGEFGNEGFFKNHIKSHGVLGDYFGNFIDGKIKMGDTPSVGFLLHGNPNNPEQTGWGGRYRKVSYRPKTIFQGHTSLNDKVEVFAIMELVLKGPDIGPANDTPQLSMVVDGQEFEGYYYGNGVYKLRICPKFVKEWSYTIKSKISEFNGKTGEFTSVPENSLAPYPKAVKHTNWWTDVLDPEFKEGAHMGAKTVNAFRRQFLMDFAQRFDRCIAPKDNDKP